MRLLSSDDVTLTVRDGAALLVSWRTPDSDLFGRVKRSLTDAFPYYARWNADERAWELPVTQRHALRQWLRMHVADEAVTWIDDTGPRSRAYSRPQTPPPGPLGDAYRRLCLTTDAPAGLAEVAYRWWVQQVHPDAGGSHDAAVAVTAAMARIRAHQLEAAS